MKKNYNQKRAQGEGDKFVKVNKFLKILADENRLKILLALKGKTMNVTEIHNQLHLPESDFASYLKLKSLGLLKRKTRRLFSGITVLTRKI